MAKKSHLNPPIPHFFKSFRAFALHQNRITQHVSNSGTSWKHELNLRYVVNTTTRVSPVYCLNPVDFLSKIASIVVRFSF